MLGIGVLGPARAAYYLESVAAGREDYYLGSGEAPGRWFGQHAITLGLGGSVKAEDLHAVLEGLDPRTGDRLDRARENRTPGFDLTFSAPKSVSIVFALADDAIAAQVRDAHDAAVESAVDWLERNACAVRRGAGGARVLNGDGFVAAGFRHRTSRAGDPHLHTHVLVANLTRGPESRWCALDGRHLFGLSKTAGHLYEAQLRYELTARLGVEWQSVHNGIADLAGIPRSLIEHLSQRRQAVLDRLDELGLSSARAAQIATLDTRAPKDPHVDLDACRIEWQESAADDGIDATAIGRLTGRVRSTGVTDTTLQGIETELLGPDGLTARASTFDRRDVIQAWCNQLPHGAPTTEIERAADQTLARSSVLELDGTATVRMRRHDGRRTEAPSLGARYTTTELFSLELRLLGDAEARAHERTAVVGPYIVEATLIDHPHLSDEQQQMVRALTQTGRGVEVVIAPAGAGKTTALTAARAAWDAAGYQTVGCAVAAKAARQLENSTGTPSHTIAALTREIAAAGLPAHAVLIVDEAGMAGTRTLASLLDAAQRAQAKIVLVGDPKQLPEIEAGGLLAALDHSLGGIHLQTNRRQRAAWERTALTELRDGHAAPALDAYFEHDRITSAPTASAARVHLARDYAAAHRQGAHALMLASRWKDVHTLNYLARCNLNDAGLLTGPVFDIADRPFQAGDRIMTLRNARRLGVTNGTTGTVVSVDAEGRSLTVGTDDGIAVTLPATYLDSRAVVHAYATTIHKAQGLTVDRAYVLADDRLTRETGYTALSRGRDENRLYTVASPVLEHDHGHLIDRNPMQDLRRALERTTAQQLAVEHDLGIEIDIG
ncbi:MAG: MobF family relaxase [Acidimicrobiia bacterium]